MTELLEYIPLETELLSLQRKNFYGYTVSPKSYCPFYAVTYNINGSKLLGQTVCKNHILVPSVREFVEELRVERLVGLLGPHRHEDVAT